MKKLLLIFSLTFGLATTANAAIWKDGNINYICEAARDGKPLSLSYETETKMITTSEGRIRNIWDTWDNVGFITWQEVDFENDTTSVWALDAYSSRLHYTMIHLDDDKDLNDKKLLNTSSGTYQCIRLSN